MINTRCADTFSEEEQNSLLDTAEKIAHYECFLHLFEQVVIMIMVIMVTMTMTMTINH